MEQVVLERFEGAHRRFVARFEHLELDRPRGLLRGKGVRIDGVAPDVGRTFCIHAPRATGNLSAGVVRLEGGVQVHSTEGGALATQSLVWSGSNRVWGSEGPVEIFGDSVGVKGGRAVFHPDRAVVRIEGPVAVEIHPTER